MHQNRVLDCSEIDALKLDVNGILQWEGKK